MHGHAATTTTSPGAASTVTLDVVSPTPSPMPKESSEEAATATTATVASAAAAPAAAPHTSTRQIHVGPCDPLTVRLPERAHSISAAPSSSSSVATAPAGLTPLQTSDDDEEDDADKSRGRGGAGVTKDDDEDEEEIDPNSIIAPAVRRRPSPPTTFLPLPMVCCLTLVGCAFVLAAMVLLFGVSSWGNAREGRVALYNRAVQQWASPHDGYATRMARARWALLDVRKHSRGGSGADGGKSTDGATESTDAARYANKTWLQPVTKQTSDDDNSGFDAISAAADDGDDPQATSSTASSAAVAAAAAAAAAASPRNANGLKDVGTDVHIYSPLFYEAKLPSPISWDSALAASGSRGSDPDTNGGGGGGGANNDDDVSPYWSRLLTHDSRTLFLQSWLDGGEGGAEGINSLINVTLPLLKKETTPPSHHTRHSCEAAMHGMYDRTTRTCSFFSQLHAICIRVKLVQPDAAAPAGGSNPQQWWSLDSREVGADLALSGSDGDDDVPPPEIAQPLTSLLISPPLSHSVVAAAAFNYSSSTSALAASNAAAVAAAAAASGVSGCIWNSITSSWSVGEYHPVDIRSEHQMAHAANTLREPNNGADSDDAESRALRHSQDLSSILKLTIRSSHDPFLVAQVLTSNVLWFGLGRAEKWFLGLVLGGVGAVFLLGPALTLAQVLRNKNRIAAATRRARRAGYNPVGSNNNSNSGSGSDATNPASPSGDSLIGDDDDDDDDEDDRDDDNDDDGDDTPTDSVQMSEFHRSGGIIHGGSGLASMVVGGGGGGDGQAGNGQFVRGGPESLGALLPPATGFVPSDALRRSLVDSSPTPAAAAAAGASRHHLPPPPPSSSSGRATRRRRIRIDPSPHYFEPTHRPASPGRVAPRPVISRKRPWILASSTDAALAAAAAARVDRPQPHRQLAKFLTGRFSFTSLFAAWTSRGNGIAAAAEAAAEADADDNDSSDNSNDDRHHVPQDAVAIARARSAAEHNKAIATAATVAEEECKQDDHRTSTAAPSPSTAESSLDDSDDDQVRVREITRVLSLAALQEQKHATSSSGDLASPISPFTLAPTHLNAPLATLTPWSSPRE